MPQFEAASESKTTRQGACPPPHVFRLTTDVRVHDAFRSITCCLCGRQWDEQFVGVALLESEIALGSVCPQCLMQTPQTAATRISGHEKDWRDLFDEVRRSSTEQPELQRLQEKITALAQRGTHLRSITTALLAKGLALQERARRLRQELTEQAAKAQHAVAESRRRREQPDEAPSVQSPTETADVLANLANRLGDAERLSIFSGELARMERWPTTVCDAVALERRCFLRHFPSLGDYALQRMVDDRYQAFLGQSG